MTAHNEPQTALSDEQASRTFEFLLNAMEDASQHANPAEVFYGNKRGAVLKYVAGVERELAALTVERDGLKRDAERGTILRRMVQCEKHKGAVVYSHALPNISAETYCPNCERDAQLADGGGEGKP